MPFTNSPWASPESELDAKDFCAVCLIDLNEEGESKVKGKCYLPVRRRPGAPYNINALRNAAARLPQTKVPPEAKRKAARRLVRLMREAGIQPGQATLRLAGMI